MFKTIAEAQDAMIDMMDRAEKAERQGRDQDAAAYMAEWNRIAYKELPRLNGTAK